MVATTFIISSTLRCGRMMTLATSLTREVTMEMAARQVSASSRHLAGGTLTSRVNSYDIAGRATSTSMIVPEIAGLIGAQLAGTYTSTTSFNADGSIQNQTLPAAGPIPTETLTTGYTPLTGQPDTLTGTLGSTTATYVQDTQYLAWGTPVAMLFGTHSGRLSQVTFQRDDTTQRLTGTDLYRSGQGGVSDESDTLSYDPAGNITQVKAALADGSVDNQCFSYDYQQQLTEAWTPTGTSCDPNGRSQANLAGPAPYWTSPSARPANALTGPSPSRPRPVTAIPPMVRMRPGRTSSPARPPPAAAPAPPVTPPTLPVTPPPDPTPAAAPKR